MEEGKIVILPQESERLQKLFSHYLNGASLQQLADLAAQSGLRFREDSEHWNKNRIARILDDGRYGEIKIFLPLSAQRRDKLLPQCADRGPPLSLLSSLSSGNWFAGIAGKNCGE